MKELNLGIIGYGFMGQWHNNHAGTLDGVNIRAVADIDPEKLKLAPESAKKYSDYHDLLADPNVEWVIISIPNDLHEEAAVAAADAGKNLIVEKPCALNTEQFDRIREAADRNHVIFTVDQNRRWDRDYSVVKKVLADGSLGKIYTITSRHYGIFGKMNDWHRFPERGGGMLYDWGVHLLDQMLDLVPGKIVQVDADMKNVLNENVDDYFRILLRFESGLSAEIELGTYMLYHLPRWYVGGDTGSLVVEDIAATKGSIYRVKEVQRQLPKEIHNIDAGPTRTFSVNAEDVVYTEPVPVINRKKNDWNDYFRNILGVINGKEELVVKPEQVRRVLAVMEAARKSAALGKSVDFE